MNTDPKDTELAEQFDGGAPTEEEAKLIAQGTDELDPAVAEAAAAAAATAEAEAAAHAAAVAETAAAAAAEAAATTTAVVPAAIELPVKPEPPKDFAAEVAKLTESYNDNDIDQAEFQAKMRELTLEESRYERKVERWEDDVLAIQTQQKTAVEDNWNKTALAFETANADFLNNPLRHKVMQDAIALVEKQAAESGTVLTNAQVLDKALAVAVDYTGYVKPADTTTADDKTKIGQALADRKVALPAKTLGDAPQAHIETVRGSETFASLDALAIPDLEIAVANMTPTQLEKFLADAPGATANGRD
jgi:hypothetical protein